MQQEVIKASIVDILTKDIKEQEDKLVSKYLGTLDDGNIKGFYGNPKLKNAGEKVRMSKAHVEEFKKCYEDPIYFIQKYVKVVNLDRGLEPITLYDYQKRIITQFVENRYNIILSCRQSGKCVSSDTLITIRNHNYNNGNSFTIAIGDFYKWQAFKDTIKNILPVIEEI